MVVRYYINYLILAAAGSHRLISLFTFDDEWRLPSSTHSLTSDISGSPAAAKIVLLKQCGLRWFLDEWLLPVRLHFLIQLSELSILRVLNRAILRTECVQS